jgi:hypothetical protein
MGPAGACSECGKARFASENEWLTWLRTPETQREIDIALGRAFKNVIKELRYLSPEHRATVLDCVAIAPVEEELSNRVDEMQKCLAMQQGFTLQGVAQLLNDMQRRIADDWIEIGRLRRAHDERAQNEGQGQALARMGNLI